MTTDTPAAPNATALRPRGPRGRHRRPPRPRRLLLGAGGLALAIGVLSLVRLVPDSGTGGSGVAQAAPSHPAPITPSVPGGIIAPGPDRPSPSASSPTDGLRASTASGRTPAPAPGGTTPDAGRGAVIPYLPDALRAPGTRVPSTVPGEPDGPRPPAPRPPLPKPPTPRPPSAPEPEPSPSPVPSRPAPPAEPDRPGLCVPLIGLCLGFTDGDG
ncbi:hypothetical protein SUDANB58_03667 [Streptomyces sp. enrichment culture]|uniref:hypothetical protein n=1 Tax=Streptomyces sp. enrichment culture TaxID=1795815 RepID=UPI003F573801